MANYLSITPFIQQREGGLSRDTRDPASAHPCPYPCKGEYGYHTNRGWTWAECSEILGVTPDSATRFFVMSDQDWDTLFKKYYWDKILGDQINSQKTANFIADWYFNSGKYATVDVQVILDNVFGNHLAEDGCLGSASIQAINATDEDKLYQDIIEKRIQFYKDIVIKTPSQEIYLDGWLNRVNLLVKYNETLK